MTEKTPPPRELRLAAYVASGVLLGAVYVLFDLVSEARIQDGTLVGALADAHAVVDHVLPLVAGALLGVLGHYLSLRAQLARAQEVALRSEALRDRLHKVDRDQAVWVLAAAVLHELNNPLHTLGLLLDELDQEPDAARSKSLLSRARAQADRALTQLALLRSMRSAGEPELSPVPLDQIVRALANDVGSLAEEDGLAVRVECDRPVLAVADATYVRTILENLVDNSLHSLRMRGHGAVTIRLATEGGSAIVRVVDDGPEIARAERATLFEPLRTTKTGGLGLGLPIARALARAMRGELTLDDASQKAFRLELPAGSPS